MVSIPGCFVITRVGRLAMSRRFFITNMYGTRGLSPAFIGPVGGKSMAKMVRKRDGQLEEFVPEKVVVSALKSGASVAVARRIGREVESKARDETPSSEIRNMVLSKLNQEDPVLEQNWQMYDRAVKRRPELEPETQRM